MRFSCSGPQPARSLRAGGRLSGNGASSGAASFSGSVRLCRIGKSAFARTPQTGGIFLGGVSTLCRSEEHTSELQSLMRISYAVFCLKKKNHIEHNHVNSDNTHYTHTLYKHN